MDGWARAELALHLFAQNPARIGGVVVRLRAGPARDRVRIWLQAHLDTVCISPSISDDQLYGGIDLSAALAHGRLIQTQGLLHPGKTVILTMAERCEPHLAAKLAHALEQRQIAGLIALDEGADEDERCPDVLAQHLALHIAPEGRMSDDWLTRTSGGDKTNEPEKLFNEINAVPAGTVKIDPNHLSDLTELAARFGIDSLRAPLLAAVVAKAHAGLCGRDQTNFTDIETAAALVFPQRATQLPDSQDDADEAPPAPPADSTAENQPDTADADETSLPSGDMLIDAVRALLPADVLSGLVPAGTTRRASGAGAGRKRIGNRRGRPLPARAGALDGRNRIDLVATLRAAAPWQTIRKAGRPRGDGVQIRPSDIRVRRYAELSDRLLIFTVDASGSAAVSRLNEAKGAIELLLAQAYAARDHVALVAFRGTTAELLLPPTRSLVQTKRRLAALPGGGGTPLAAGLHDAATLATQARQRGMSPTVVLLTDGRANIALDGLPDRARAADDATQAARALRAAQVPALVIDAGNRPSRALRTLSEVLDGQYLPLPRADAHGLSGAVSAALDG